VDTLPKNWAHFDSDLGGSSNRKLGCFASLRHSNQWRNWLATYREMVAAMVPRRCVGYKCRWRSERQPAHHLLPDAPDRTPVRTDSLLHHAERRGLHRASHSAAQFEIPVTKRNPQSEAARQK